MSAKATALGALLKARRTPMGWKRLEALTGIDERTMRYWEAGVMPPLDKALIVARALGITLEELEAAVSVEQVGARGDGNVEAVGDAIGARPVGRAASEQQKRRRRS